MNIASGKEGTDNPSYDMAIEVGKISHWILLIKCL